MQQWLSRWCLNLLYTTLLCVLSPILLWQQLRGSKKRTDWQQRLWGPDLNGDHHIECDPPPLRFWLHAVSVGEVNLLVTLLPALKETFPTAQFAISASTDTGLELARSRFPDCLVFRFPIDFSWAVEKIFRTWKPSMLILTELEVWPNTISLAQINRVPVVVVNGRLSEKSFHRYQMILRLVQPWFRSLNRVVAQTPTYADRFERLGVPREQIEIAGSIKFDAASTNRDNAQTTHLRKLLGLQVSNRPVWLAGSTSAPEEQMICQVFGQLKTDFCELQLIVVPRHRERFEEVAQLLKTHCGPWKFLRRSLVENEPKPDWDILLVDTIGELSAWWGAADIGFVGGSFGTRGGQSMIEPAGFAVATCFGPNTSNFRDVVELLIANEAATQVADADQLETFVRRCLEDATYRCEMGERAQQLVLTQEGATRRTVAAISKTLKRANVGI